MDPTARGVLIGLASIIVVCGAVLHWVHLKSAAPMDFIERHLGFFARRWRRLNRGYAHYSTCHDHHSGGVRLGVQVTARAFLLAIFKEKLASVLLSTIRDRSFDDVL